MVGLIGYKFVLNNIKLRKDVKIKYSVNKSSGMDGLEYIRKFKNLNFNKFMAYKLDLNFGYKNIYPNIGNSKHNESIITGFQYRLCRDTGLKPMTAKLQTRLHEYVYHWCKSHLTPISMEADLSVESWLQGTHYTMARKESLYKTYLLKQHYVTQLAQGHISNKLWKLLCYVKVHVKQEFLEAIKSLRMICARTDTAKVILGPLSKKMENQIYHANNEVIKYYKDILPGRRAEFMRKNFSYPNIMCTDYSSFEGSFRPNLMKSVECVMYKHMLVNFPMYSKIFQRLATTNELKFKNLFTATLEGTRMSGEMVTSLSNGFTNMMLMLFVCKMNGYVLVDGLVEGDDGIFVFADNRMPKSKDFEMLGFNVKAFYPRNFYEASFCGQVINPETLDLLAEPKEFMNRVNFSYSDRACSNKHTVRRALLVAKLLSYLSMYPNCPVIAPICYKKILSIKNCVDYTVVKKILNTDQEYYYDVHYLNLKINFDPIEPIISPTSRRMVEELWGMSPGEQLMHENNFVDGSHNTTYGPHDSYYKLIETESMYDYSGFELLHNRQLC